MERMATKPPKADIDEAQRPRHRPQEGRGRRARGAARAADLERADGRPAQHPDAPAGQPEGRLRLPRVRVARGGQAAHRGVLRERREGRRRGGDDPPGRRRSSSPSTRIDELRGARRLVARPAGPADASDDPRRGCDALPSDLVGRRAARGRRRAAGPRRPERGDLLHLGPHLERGGVPLPAAGARVRHEQPAGLLEHVPRVVRLGADRDDRHRQGHGLDRGHPRGRPAHRRRAEPRHEPPAHAQRAREGEGQRARRSSR